MHVIERPMVEAILHKVGVEEMVRMLLPNVEVCRVVQKEVRTDVVRTNRRLLPDSTEEFDEARLVQAVETG